MAVSEQVRRSSHPNEPAIEVEIKYQLVIQLPARDEADLDRLFTIEDAIVEAVADMGDVDGHDMGAGEMNIFVYTDVPTDCFRKVAAVPEVTAVLTELKAAYREAEGEEYTVIYPSASVEFSVT